MDVVGVPGDDAGALSLEGADVAVEEDRASIGAADRGQWAPNGGREGEVKGHPHGDCTGLARRPRTCAAVMRAHRPSPRASCTQLAPFSRPCNMALSSDFWLVTAGVCVECCYARPRAMRCAAWVVQLTGSPMATSLTHKHICSLQHVMFCA
jgi:hypothetical protein